MPLNHPRLEPRPHEGYSATRSGRAFARPSEVERALWAPVHLPLLVSRRENGHRVTDVEGSERKQKIQKRQEWR